MITFKIAVRNIFRHKPRSMITLSTIIFGCVALIFAGGFFEDVFYKIRESYIHSHIGHIQIYAKGYLEKGRSEPFNYLIDNPGKIISVLKNVSEVKFISQRFEFAGLLSTGENTVSFMGMGVDPEYEQSKVVSDKFSQKAINHFFFDGVLVNNGEGLNKDDFYSVILGKGLAASMGAHPRDPVVLLTNTVNGSVNALDVSVKGIFYTSTKAFDDHFLIVPLPTAQKLLATNSVQSLVVMLNKTEDTQKVKNEFMRLFKENNLSLELKTWNEINEFYNQTVTLFNRLFFILKLVIVIIVILSIFNTMNMAVLERISEIGTIMALGTKRVGVLNLFMYEGLALGAIGGVLGIGFGVLITYFISSVGIPMPPPPASTMPWVSEPKIVPGMLYFVFFLSIVTSLISSLFPAYKASRLEIADALRHR